VVWLAALLARQGDVVSCLARDSTTAAEALADALLVREDETAMLWDKLVFLAPVALLTTDADAPVGVVRADRGGSHRRRRGPRRRARRDHCARDGAAGGEPAQTASRVRARAMTDRSVIAGASSRRIVTVP